MMNQEFTRARLPARPAPLVVACLVALGGMASGQTPPAASSPAAPRLTREELLSRFDINRDGKIDQGELELAGSKMRLERAELRLSRGIDPVTGLPRDDEPDGADRELDPTDEPVMSVDELARRLGFESPRPDAARPPTPAAADGQSTLQPRIFGLTPPSAPPATGLEAAPTPPAPGGVRAGGRPALPGYGSGVRPPSFNAGRADRLPPPKGDRQAVAGGLVPRLQPPPRPAPAPPRRTVEDFNVY